MKDYLAEIIAKLLRVRKPQLCFQGNSLMTNINSDSGNNDSNGKTGKTDSGISDNENSSETDDRSFSNDNKDDSKGSDSNGDQNPQAPDSSSDGQNSDQHKPRVTIHRVDSGHDKNGSERSLPPKSPFPSFIILLAACLLICLLFSNFFGASDKMTVSWNGFNYLLVSGKIDTVNLKGNAIQGELTEPPVLWTVPKIIPNGDQLFDKLLRKAAPKLTAIQRAAIISECKDGDPDKVNKYWGAQYKKIKNRKKEEKTVPGYYEIVYKLDNGKVKRTGYYITSDFSCEIPITAYADQNLDEKIRNGVKTFTSETPSDRSGMITMIISIGLTIFLIWMIFRMRRTVDQGNYLNTFSSSPARRYEPNSGETITFKDVAGLENVKQELVEIVDFLKNPEKYRKMGARVPKGTLLFGPPGTGKTLLGRAVAGEAGVPFFSINGSEFIQLYVGVGASRVRDLFNVAKQNAPSILFIDEIDAVGRQRGTGLGGGHDEREQTLNQILSEMDGFTQTESVMVMAATNRPDVLDQALMRPGRFDRHITVDRPSLKGRVDIFKVYLTKIPCADDVDAERLARSTVGFTGADIRNLVNEAALWATRNNKTKVDMADLEFAHEKVVMGLKREEVISDEEKRNTAYHEAGHTIIGWFTMRDMHVQKVTIIPRGQALGVTYFLPEEEQLNITESKVRAKLAMTLGGRAAERLIFNEISAGAESDLKQATQTARRMVVNWGMSPKLGPLAFRTGESHPFLGREISESREYSEATAQIIDEEIRRILDESDHQADTILNEKRELLDKLSSALIEEEELDTNRLTEILGPSPFPPKPIK